MKGSIGYHALGALQLYIPPTQKIRYNVPGDKMKEEEQKILDCIVEQIKKFNPENIVLFGSFSTPRFRPGSSDIDLCIIMNFEDKSQTITELYYEIKAGLPIDFLLYTPEEWTQHVQDPCSFAYHIQRTGKSIYPGE
jgi:predicted nucleotidyltransferase